MSATGKSLLKRLGDRADSTSWRQFIDIDTPLIRGWLLRHGVQPTDGGLALPVLCSDPTLANPVARSQYQPREIPHGSIKRSASANSTFA
jgi:pantothenate kinase-related protein Tda10